LECFDLSQYKAPYLKYEEIRKKADEFRAKYWENQTIPVDILYIIEFKLNLDIIPIKNLKSYGDIDSFLLGDLSGIAVDSDEYMDDRYLNRIRFSIAHEIGHLVLHSDIYKKCKLEPLKEIQDWITFIKTVPEKEYNWFELQAYEFAGRLLVPINELQNEINKFNTEIETAKSLISDIDNYRLAEYLAPNIANKFQVSPEVIVRRINVEKIF